MLFLLTKLAERLIVTILSNVRASARPLSDKYIFLNFPLYPPSDFLNRETWESTRI